MKKLTINSTVLILLTIVPGLFLYHKLPQNVPVHFNIYNQPDGWMPRIFVIAGMPILLAGLNVFCLWVSGRDKKMKENNYKYLWIGPALIVVVSWFTMASILCNGIGISLDIGRIALLFVGLVLVFLGNYLPKVSQNRVLGIRTKWTLESESIWNRTNRIGGYVMAASGLIAAISAFVLPVSLAALLTMVLLAGEIIFVIWYSWYLYKKKK